MKKKDIDRLLTICYTLWTPIHDLPEHIVIEMVVRNMRDEQVEGYEMTEIQDFKNYLHEKWFWDEIRNQGIDQEIDPDALFDWYEETWNNL